MAVERGMNTYREITSQGQAWQLTLPAFEEQAPGVEELLRQPFAQTLFTGCGSTYYLSLAAAAAWQALTGRSARGAPASEIWLQTAGVLTAQPTLLVPVSRSAETTETLRALDAFRARGGQDVLAISVYGDRALVRRAGRALVTRGAEEESIAQTRSFTSMYLLALAAAGLAGGHTDQLAMLQKLPAAFSSLLAQYESLARALAQNLALERFVFLGSGANYGLACEAMLKMKEMSLSPSEAFHFLEFRHGPKSVVAPGTLIVGLLGEAAQVEEVKVLAEMQALGASVLAIADSPAALPADYQVALETGLSELARSPLLLAVPQLLAYYRAIQKGLDPDRPTNLDAVVIL